MTHHPLRARVRRLEQRIAEASRPGLADSLRNAKAERAGMTPAELARRDAERLAAGLKADPDSIAGILARRRAARLKASAA